MIGPRVVENSDAKWCFEAEWEHFIMDHSVYL